MDLRTLAHAQEFPALWQQLARLDVDYWAPAGESNDVAIPAFCVQAGEMTHHFRLRDHERAMLEVGLPVVFEVPCPCTATEYLLSGRGHVFRLAVVALGGVNYPSPD